jgi:hypothetical protein
MCSMILCGKKASIRKRPIIIWRSSPHRIIEHIGAHRMN